MPELSRGSPAFRCRFIRKGFNSIPQVVRSSSIAPSHIRSQLCDRRSGKLASTWSITIAGDNFPMALRRDAEQILTVFRNPAKLGVFSIKDGALVSSLGGVRSSLSRIHSDLDVILKHANASPGRSRQGRTSHFARPETGLRGWSHRTRTQESVRDPCI